MLLETESIDEKSLRNVVERGELYAVLDACDEPCVPLLVEGLGDALSVSLYRSEAEEEYSDIAPYLVRVSDARLLEWIIQFSVTEGWGIFIMTTLPLEVLRTHLRKFLKVRDPEGKHLYFRFYDPRVLEMFLPTCDATQLEQFYGKVQTYATFTSAGTANAFRIAR